MNDVFVEQATELMELTDDEEIAYNDPDQHQFITPEIILNSCIQTLIVSIHILS